eukprot:m.52339 g.52339  ORF g.52339 m.52339 type:complete len:62 (-) comp10992_c0_seq1:376-561(-)
MTFPDAGVVADSARTDPLTTGCKDAHLERRGALLAAMRNKLCISHTDTHKHTQTQTHTETT